MIRKLLKVEFREAFSSMLPVGAGMLVLSALTALNSAITARIRVSSAGFDWLGALLAFATAVCFISVLAVCFFANVNRFYRMLGEEGYIQLTLPATMSQHIAAKLIAAVVTTLVTFLFLAVCSSLMAFPEAKVRETGVACKNTKADRVIVTISYELNGKNGDYGFDYEKDENGEYVLKRYGGGVSSDDL